MADEFAPELAEGAAYVAGYDDEARPVLVNTHAHITYSSVGILGY